MNLLISPNFFFFTTGIYLLDFISEGEISVECRCSARKTVSLQFIILEFFVLRPAKLVMRNVSVFIFVLMLEDVLDYVGMFLG